MKKFLITLAVFGTALACALPAGAATRYGAIGSPNGVQSQEFAIAALTLHEYPSAVITPAQVAAAHVTDTTEFGGSEPQMALTYLIFTGFDGDHAQSVSTVYAQTASANLIAAANGGGVYVIVNKAQADVDNEQPQGAIDLVHATSKLVTSINAKGTYTMTWKVFLARYNPVGADQFFAVNWTS